MAKVRRRDTLIETAASKLHKNYGYDQLTAEQRRGVELILQGPVGFKNLPKPPRRSIRLFVSSTFKDTAEERNFLLQVFAKVALKCRSRYGVEFHALDLRWGIPKEAQIEHLAAELCLQEVRNCYTHSLGPHFLAVLGHRYGYIDLPNNVRCNYFEAIIFELVGKYNIDKVTILHQWYKKDTNKLPEGTYVLQPSTLANEKWEDIEIQLYDLIVEGTQLAVKNGSIPEEFLQNLQASVTEKEIRAGVTDLPEGIAPHLSVLCIVRTITDIEEHINHPSAKYFLDMMSVQTRGQTKTVVDRQKLDRTKDMQQLLLPALPQANIFQYDVNFHDMAVVKQTTASQIEWKKQRFYGISEIFRDRLDALIAENVRRQNTIEADFLYNDAAQHWYSATNKCALFLGRERELADIRSYILSDNTTCPLVIRGEIGTGKSTLIAQAASEVKRWFILKTMDAGLLPVILRFCGLTPQSSQSTLLLNSINHQIAHVMSKSRQNIPMDYEGAINYFRKFAQFCDKSQQIVIFINGVDVLQNKLDVLQNNVLTLVDWLPRKLSPNAKIILGINASENGKIYDILCRKYPNIENLTIEMTEIGVEKCCEMLQSFLQSRNHGLTQAQWELVTNVFQACSLPLLVQFTLEEVLHWKSYTQPDKVTLSLCVKDSILKLFQRLERKHSIPLFSKVVSYITLSGEGISESELEHICSLDDDLLSGVFVYWQPPIRRLHSMLLLRIKHDMESYITEKSLDDTDVIYWRYSSFESVAQEMYLSDHQKRKQLHWTIAEYYMGVWCHKAKPYRYKDVDSAALRYVPKQPLVFTKNEDTKTSGKTVMHYNFRKLNRMPHHLAEGGRLLTLYSQVLFNYEWICTKIKATSIQKVIEDYQRIDRPEVNLVRDALRMAESAIAANPEVVGVELTGRLLAYYQTYDNIRHLIAQCDEAAPNTCCVLPNWQVYKPPGGPLQYTCEVDTNITSALDADVVEDGDSVFLTTKSYYSNRMRVWDISLGVSLNDVVMPVESTVHPSPDGNLLHVIERKKYLTTYSFRELFHEAVDPISRIDFGHGDIQEVNVSNSYVVIIKKHTKGPVVIDVKNAKIIKTCDYDVSTAVVSKNEQYLLTNNGCGVLLHILPSMVLTATIPVEARPIKMLLTSKNRTFLMLDEKNNLALYYVSSGTSNGLVQDKEIKHFCLSNKEEMILVLCDKCIYIFSRKLKRPLHRIQKMPDGHFKEKLTKFTAASFNSTDELIIAARHTYIACWDAKTAEPLKVFQTSVSKIIFFQACSTSSLGITVHDDFSIHVWNTDNFVSEEVGEWHGVLRSGVKCMSASQKGNRIVCCGVRFPEAICLNIATMEPLCTVEHSDDARDALNDVIMSPTGNVMATRMPNKENKMGLKPWALLRHDKFWDVESGQCIYEISDNRYIVFSSDGCFISCFHCQCYNVYDWSRMQYDLVVFDLRVYRKTTQSFITLPVGDVIGHPVNTDCGRYICFLLQMLSNQPSNSSERINEYNTQLCVHDFKNDKADVRTLDINFKGNSEKNLIPLDIEALADRKFLIMVGTSENGYVSHNEDGTLHLRDLVPEECLIFSLNSESVLIRHCASKTLPVAPSICSLGRTLMMSLNGDIYDAKDSEHVLSTIDLTHVAKNGVVFLLDGKYAAILLENRKEVMIVCTATRERRGHLYVHGHALHISSAIDDRTLVVACRDSRILVFSIVVDLGDKLGEFIKALPSRQYKRTKTLTGVCTAARSAVRISRNSISEQPVDASYYIRPPTKQAAQLDCNVEIKGTSVRLNAHVHVHNDRMKELAITQTKIEQIKKKFPSLRTVGTVARLTQPTNTRSTMCCIQ